MKMNKSEFMKWKVDILGYQRKKKNIDCGLNSINELFAFKLNFFGHQ